MGTGNRQTEADELQRDRARLTELRTREPREYQREAGLTEAIGIHLAMEERFAEAEATFREAIAIGEEHGDPMRHQRQQALAGAIAAQGRAADALSHYRLGLEFALLDCDESNNSIAVARYFLANHLAQMRLFEEALALIPEGILWGQRPMMHCLRAQCHNGLGQISDAKTEAEKAVAACESDAERMNIQDQLIDLLA
tara:strand:+ start:28442 stop:29035 length:594 start_codon:yes stop_codon:yes gene_type:complete